MSSSHLTVRRICHWKFEQSSHFLPFLHRLCICNSQQCQLEFEAKMYWGAFFHWQTIHNQNFGEKKEPSFPSSLLFGFVGWVFFIPKLHPSISFLGPAFKVLLRCEKIPIGKIPRKISMVQRRVHSGYELITGTGPSTGWAPWSWTNPCFFIVNFWAGRKWLSGFGSKWKWWKEREHVETWYIFILYIFLMPLSGTGIEHQKWRWWKTTHGTRNSFF